MKIIRLVVGLIILIGGITLAYKSIPPYFHHFEFEDAVQSEARLGMHSGKSETDIRETLYKKAKELDIPITPEQIVVQRLQSELKIRVAYRVHVDMPFKPFDINFIAESSKDKI